MTGAFVVIFRNNGDHGRIEIWVEGIAISAEIIIEILPPRQEETGGRRRAGPLMVRDPDTASGPRMVRDPDMGSGPLMVRDPDTASDPRMVRDPDTVRDLPMVRDRRTDNVGEVTVVHIGEDGPRIRRFGSLLQ